MNSTQTLTLSKSFAIYINLPKMLSINVMLLTFKSFASPAVSIYANQSTGSTFVSSCRLVVSGTFQ